jgi:hypothetical protein
MVLIEMTSLLEKEEITPMLGGSTNMLLIYEKSFSSSENGPGWEFTFHLESGPRFLMDMYFFSSENGPD